MLTDRPASRARYCRQCRQFHPAEEYDGWLETSGWLFARTAKVRHRLLQSSKKATHSHPLKITAVQAWHCLGCG